MTMYTYSRKSASYSRNYFHNGGKHINFLALTYKRQEGVLLGVELYHMLIVMMLKQGKEYITHFSKFIKLYSLNEYILLHINYTS